MVARTHKDGLSSAVCSSAYTIEPFGRIFILGSLSCESGIAGDKNSVGTSEFFAHLRNVFEDQLSKLLIWIEAVLGDAIAEVDVGEMYKAEHVFVCHANTGTQLRL